MDSATGTYVWRDPFTLDATASSECWSIDDPPGPPAAPTEGERGAAGGAARGERSPPAAAEPVPPAALGVGASAPESPPAPDASEGKVGWAEGPRRARVAARDWLLMRLACASCSGGDHSGQSAPAGGRAGREKERVSEVGACGGNRRRCRN